ncbi:MAG TPA: cytochrome c oxidase subunit II transmembrane domain-containing protein [Bryobacteraceae bacterium]|nr:cytochrome c oxidase subunit II transmembrane domain-containing protein [Bryobacteraceae bacterium]
MIKAWWLPAAISQHAVAYDAQFLRTLAAATVIFIAVQIALIAIVWRYRANSAGVRRVGARKTNIEAIWTAATAVLFLGLLALGGRIWAAVQFTPAPPDAELIEVLAKQFAWTFRYAGPDGRFGRIDFMLVNDAAGNPFGLDPEDPDGKDDIVSATLRVPAGRPVQLMLNSMDVIHSFFVRELRLKQDVVPGMRIPLHFTATRPGVYEIPCAELCGLGHSQMRSTMIVLTPAEYDAWKRGQPQ